MKWYINKNKKSKTSSRKYLTNKEREEEQKNNIYQHSQETLDWLDKNYGKVF